MKSDEKFSRPLTPLPPCKNRRLAGLVPRRRTSPTCLAEVVVSSFAGLVADVCEQPKGKNQ